jgi:hypothetical protein
MSGQAHTLAADGLIRPTLLTPSQPNERHHS